MITTREPGVPLSPALRALIAHVVSPLSENAALIEAHAAAAAVTSDSPTVIDLEVAKTARPLPLQDGPIPVRAIVYDSEQPIGEILVWIRDGKLVGRPETAAAIGRRKSAQVTVLTIDAAAASADGVVFLRGNDAVWLVEQVPPQFIEAR